MPSTACSTDRSPTRTSSGRPAAERLGGVPLTGAWYAPSTIGTETAEIIRERLPSIDPKPSALLFDCVPSGPTPEVPRAFSGWFASATPRRSRRGARRWRTRSPSSWHRAARSGTTS